jgi:hypothetical protein
MKQKKVTHMESDSDYKWEAERLRDRQKVKGIFRFHEVPGGTLSFSFRKWRGDLIESYDLVDGQSYELPLGVATHLKESGWYPVHKHAVDAAGKSIKAIGQRVKRYNFEPLQFIADERWHTSNADKDIVTVTHL